MAIDNRLAGTGLPTLLTNFFTSIAAGNEGYAEIEDLRWENGYLIFNIKIRHHQVFSENILGKHIQFDVYDVTTYVKGKINPLDPSHGEINFCVDTPVGQQCITLKAILQHIVDILKSVGIIAGNPSLQPTS
jgi:hypothetical protein